MEKRITAHVLRYLLHNRFKSKAEMARQLGLHQRTIEKVFKNLDMAKAGTIAFEKAISYCAQHHISVDSILKGFVADLDGDAEEGDVHMVSGDERAYDRLRVTKPESLSSEGEEVFTSMLVFLRKASSHVCPSCRVWCNPWAGKHAVEDRDCYIGHMAREIRRDVAEFYTQEGANQ